ncbi:MAG: PrgI family protein [Clostridia bacterium]|nr:PrgI family protein [Clostridia bacterium]
MAYVPVPKDLTKVKTKFLFNLTKRQLVCFGGGALVGVPLFFLLKDPIGTSTAALIMVFVMLPFFLLAMFERNGQPLEKVAKNMANVLFLRPKQRPYMTNNFYDCLARQNQLDKEVHSVIHGKTKTHQTREKAD